jgi:hypothetical protein
MADIRLINIFSAMLKPVSSLLCLFRGALIFMILLVTADQSFSQKIGADTTALTLTKVQQTFGLDAQQPLIDRVQNTSGKTLERFRQAGMSPTQHALTNAERGQLEKVLASLPPLHHHVLKGHLRSISFLDNMPNTALTAIVNYGSDFPIFDITVRADILNQTASEWMTEKERTCFNPENSSIEVSCEIGSLSALLYVMLHETTHMVDGTLKLAQMPEFSSGIWQNRTKMAPEFTRDLLDSTRYRGGKPLPIESAKDLYQILKSTPSYPCIVQAAGMKTWQNIFQFITSPTNLNSPFASFFAKTAAKSSHTSQ